MKETQKMTKTESMFGLQVVGWLGGESFLRSNIEISNVLIETEKNGFLKADIRWKRRLNNGINGMILIQKENNEYDILFTNFGRHNGEKKMKSKVIKRYQKVITRQVPDLFQETTGFDIVALKS